MRLLTLVFLAQAMLTSCTSDKDPFGKMNDFDQGPMLENLANNLIVPSYLGLRDQTKSDRKKVTFPKKKWKFQQKKVTFPKK